MSSAAASWTERLARVCARHPWHVLGAWGAALFASVVIIVLLLPSALTTEQGFVSTPDSARALDLIETHVQGDRAPDELLIIRPADGDVDTPATRARIDALVTQAERTVGADGTVIRPTDDNGLIAPDRSAALIGIAFPDDAAGEAHIEALMDLAASADIPEAVEVAITGEYSTGADFERVSAADLKRAEVFGLGVALIVLLLVFGAVVASLLPVAMSLVSITVAMAFVSLTGQVAMMSFFVTNMLVMMGLALGIDYALFIISRFREERAAGRTVPDAVGVTGASAHKAVFFSGLTVVIALVGMLIVPSTVFVSLGAGAIFAALTSVAVALTLLPATLALLGDRVDALRLPFLRRRTGHEGGIWSTLTTRVMRRPVMSLVLGVAFLLALAMPFASINTGFAGVETVPDSFASKRGFELLVAEFPAGQASPANIVIVGTPEDPEVMATAERIEDALAARDDFAPATRQPAPDGQVLLLSAPMRADANSADAEKAIRDLRTSVIPQAVGEADLAVYVGGTTAGNVDFLDITDRYLGIVVAIVLALSFLLLLVAFRSIVIPALSVVLNLLSVCAAYGLVVAVSQRGWGNEWFGFEQVDTVEAWIPLFLFCVLFGLSMDYNVFLLSRVRERYLERGDTNDAIAHGVRTTGRLITGAALIMVAVFGGFASGNLVMFQQMGFGLAVAVLIDATLVRTVIAPACMTLLGRWNWYLPPWLEWLPRVSIEGSAAPVPKTTTTAP